MNPPVIPAFYLSQRWRALARTVLALLSLAVLPACMNAELVWEDDLTLAASTTGDGTTAVGPPAITFANVDGSVLLTSGLSAVTLSGTAIAERDTLLVLAFGLANNTTITPPAGFVSRSSTSSSGGGAASQAASVTADKLISTLGTTGGISATAGAIADSLGVQLLLKRSYYP